ncbi:MAG: protein kinase [candidate division Zixibacteria bacterium]|nr:protein kinase [candidate division Zixibacteria bacterium]
MIGKTISHYKILEKLGEGGMGVVYKAQDTKLKRTVALKFLPRDLLCDSEAKARFIHEAQAASALNHPNITTIHEVDEIEGECFISMEYIEGRSIKELVEKKGLSIEEILKIAIQVAEGLSRAHQKDIVHRDIKSDNIMLTHDGLAKIMDFGLAKLKGVTKLTKTGSTLGTLQYMSPEQAQGIEVDQRSDIFSFGVVLYEMITRQLPFKGEHEAAIIYSIINETPEPLARYKANVPGELQRIVYKTLQKDRNIRYQSAAEVIADLKGLQKETAGVSVVKSKKKLLPFIVSASIVFILVLLFLILKPFEVKIDQGKKAIAQENSLAIMYFENLKDPEDKDKIAQMITSLLITGLSESPQYMRVMSSQRLYDILKLLGKEGMKVIDKTVASEVAKKAGVKWILTGKVLKTEPNIVLISEISEASTGNILATQRISGATGEDLFAVVDKLSLQIAKDLSLPEQAKKELDKPITDVTTHSLEAYRYYLEGIDYTKKVYFKEANESFKKALEYDSTFAMAYYRLAQYSWNEEFLAKAVKYSKKVSQKEKHYIKSLEALVSGNYAEAVAELTKIVERYPDEKEAYLSLGYYYEDYLSNPEEAILQYIKILEIDPLFKEAYNYLAYAYNEIGDFDKSIWAINKYIDLAPNEANPYDSRGDLYAYNGKLDQAIESFKRAGEIKPNYSIRKLGNMYLFKREYAKAESCYKELCSSTDKDTRSAGRFYLAYIPLYQGKFEEALKVLDDGITADRMEKIEEWQNVYKRFLKAVIYREKDLNLAMKEFEKCIEINLKHDPDNILFMPNYYVLLLAEKGDFKKAQEVADALKKYSEEKDKTYIWDYWYAVGCIELSKGNLEASVANFEKLVKAHPGIYSGFLLANAYLESGKLGEAVAELEKIISVYNDDQAFNAIRAVKAYYLLGLAYDKSGWNKKAIEKYEEFLDIWKNADLGIPEVADARERLKRLKSRQ